MPNANDLNPQLQTSTNNHPYAKENFWLDKYKYVDAEEFYALGNLFFRKLLAGGGDSSITMDQFMKRFDQLEKEQKAMQQQVNHMSRDILEQLSNIQKQLGGKPVSSGSASGDARVKTTSTSESNIQQKSQPQQQKQQQTTANKEEKKTDDDDVDLFGSDDEEESEETARIKAERVKAYSEKKSTKPALIAKSNVILDVKPWDDETDMKKLEEAVRTVEMDGLLWGVSKLVPLAYGIKKLQITCVVEDEKVSIEELSEKLQEFEDFVQSVDIAAFNKI